MTDDERLLKEMRENMIDFVTNCDTNELIQAHDLILDIMLEYNPVYDE